MAINYLILLSRQGKVVRLTTTTMNEPEHAQT